MYAQKERLKENKIISVFNSVTQKKEKVRQKFGYMEYEPGTNRQRKIQEQVHNYAQMQLVLQRKFEERKVNNNKVMRDVMRTHRQAEGMWNKTGCQKNFAVNIRNTAQYGFSDEGGHSERNLLVLMLPSHSVGDPIDIHTERETCISCYTLLKKTHDDAEGTANAFDMNISYTVAYPGNGDSKDKLYEYYNSKSDMP